MLNAAAPDCVPRKKEDALHHARRGWNAGTFLLTVRRGCRIKKRNCRTCQMFLEYICGPQPLYKMRQPLRCLFYTVFTRSGNPHLHRAQSFFVLCAGSLPRQERRNVPDSVKLDSLEERTEACRELLCLRDLNVLFLNASRSF